MPYTITHYNGTQLAVIADGTLDSTTSLKLVGKNYAGYGTVQNDNFVYLLENFAGATPPNNAIPGQIWYDNSTNKLKFLDDNMVWRTAGGSVAQSTPPTGLTVGDMWYDTVNNQLWVYNGNTFILVGPQGVANAGTTEMVSVAVYDTTGATHSIIEAVTNNEVVFIISPDSAFTLDATKNAIAGFDIIQQGVTLAYTQGATNGVTSQAFRFWGTATNADKLGGHPVTDFVLAGGGTFNQQVNFSDAGYTVGNPPKLQVFNSGTTTPTIQNILNDTIVFQTTSGNQLVTPLQLTGLNVLPGSDNISSLGSISNRFSNVYAVTFNGLATEAQSLLLGANPLNADTNPSPNTIAARTNTTQIINGVSVSAGALQATYFVGTATAANYADLAEKYLADAEYEVGTVVSVGGVKEVTACKSGDRAIGAVSANPAYMMNAGLEGGTFIALKGRVPVKVVGPVKKGDRLSAADNGCAVSTIVQSSDAFGIALEDNADTGVKLVECIIL